MDFLQKVMGYWIYKIYAKLVPGYSPISPFLPVLAIPAVLAILAVSIVLVVLATFFQAVVTGMEFTKTDTSFLALFLGSEDIYWSNDPFFYS